MLDQKAQDLAGVMMPLLDERQRRIFLGAFSAYLGRGSVTDLHDLTGVSRVTIIAGRREAEDCPRDPHARPGAGDFGGIRSRGAGRRPVRQIYPEIEDVLRHLLAAKAGEDADGPLSWTTRSLRELREDLAAAQISISHSVVSDLLGEMGFTQRSTRRVAGSALPLPDRDAQFRLISRQAQSFLEAGLPVISVDAKLQELTRTQADDIAESRSADTLDSADADGKLSRVYSPDTAAFAAECIERWWEDLGRTYYPHAREMLVTADAGSCCQIWKERLQDFADSSGLELRVAHFPAGTARWRMTEQRVVSSVSKSLRDGPQTRLEVTVCLVAEDPAGARIPQAGSRRPGQDPMSKPRGTDENPATAEQSRHSAWRGEWNYVIAPHSHCQDAAGLPGRSPVPKTWQVAAQARSAESFRQRRQLPSES